MYKLNDKSFSNATEALDHYIKDFQLCHNYKNMETSVAKSTQKQFRIEKLENIMSTNLKKNIFNNLIGSASSTSGSSGNTSMTLSSSEGSLFNEMKKDETGLDAINQVEKLINNLSSKVEDYKSEGSSFSKHKDGTISSTSSSYMDFSSKMDQLNGTDERSKQIDLQYDQDDPILRSISKFEDLNKQLSSNNLFTKVESSLPPSPVPISIENKKVKPIVMNSKTRSVTSPSVSSEKFTTSFETGPYAENFISECMKIINTKS